MRGLCNEKTGLREKIVRKIWLFKIKALPLHPILKELKQASLFAC
jgi:hypothetical protein